MLRTSRSRMLGLATAVATVSLGAAAVPAYADGMQLVLSGVTTVQIPAKPVPHQQFDESFHLDIGRTGSATAHDVKLSFDTSGLAGIANLSLPGCTAAGTTFTCNEGELNFDRINITWHPLLDPAPGVKPGTSGHLKVTATSSNAQSTSLDIRVDVGTPDFKAKDLVRATDIKAGTVLAPAVEFGNLGDTPATKVVVAVDAISGLALKQHPSNCEYGTESAGGSGDQLWPGHTVEVCTVDAAVAPGEVFTLDPIQLGVTDTEWYSFADISLFPSEDAQNSDIPRWRQQIQLQRGTDKPLTAAKSSDPSLVSGTRHLYDNRVEQEVLTTNEADFAAFAAWAPNADGSQGTLTIGQQDNGPAGVMDRSGGEGLPQVKLALPDGVTVTTVPHNCRVLDQEAGKQINDPRKYICAPSVQGYTPSGAQQKYAFGIKVNPGTSQPAAVSLQNSQSLYEPGHPTAVMLWDHNAANDAVTVALGTQASGGIPVPTPTHTPTGTTTTPPAVVQPTATPTQPGQAPSGSASASSSGSTHSGLAFTGTEGIGTTVGLGLGAIALGGGVILYTARRRKAGAHQ